MLELDGTVFQGRIISIVPGYDVVKKDEVKVKKGIILLETKEKKFFCDF
jgi:hypothetical protein